MIQFDRRTFVTGIMLATAVSLFAATSAQAGGKVNTSFFGSVAIEGYDPVAYFASGGPEKGQSQFQVKWKGVTWRFSSAKNRAAFAKMPEKYAPQYGGYCAWAVSEGYTAGIDPKAWKIVDSKLYLNNSAAVQATWVKDIPGHIKKADSNWPGIEKAL